MFFANLLVYMMAIYRQDGSWTKLVQQHHAECPGTISDPWGLILYCDEIIPGNVLGRAERKVWTIYATFLQFGDHLSHEDAWLTISVERSTFVATLDGGIAQMMGHVLQSIFCCPIQDPRLGFRLKATSGDTTLFFNLSMVLADGAAQKQVWSSKGDSGTKFCLLCANVHGQVAKHADEEPYEFHCATTQYSQLRLVTDQELLDSYQRLHTRSSSCTKKAFAQWQQATGLTYSRHALMLNQPLLEKGIIRPATQFCHDWMHGVLQGTAPCVLYHLFTSLATECFDCYGFFEKYFQCWEYPKGWKASHFHQLFEKKKMEKSKNARKFSCTAAECLAIYPIVRHCMCTIIQPQGLAVEAVDAFLAMSEVIDQCHGGVQWKATTWHSLLSAVERANAAFEVAWPEETMIKKWHWHLHLPDALSRFSNLPSCFTAERKHKSISALATKLQKTTSYEKHLLQQVPSNEICTLQHPELFPKVCHMWKPKPATQQVQEAMAPFLNQPCLQAQSSTVAILARGGQVSGGDAIIFAEGHDPSKWKVALAIKHVQVFGLQTTLAQLWPIQTMDQYHAKCKVTASNGLIPLSNILFPVPYSQSKGQVTVLLPYQCYSRR